MLLPRQRVKIAVNDASHTRMVCGCLDIAAATGASPCFGVVGIDPLSGQPLSFGVECEVVNSNLATGTMQVELVGRRCFTVRDTLRQREGYSVAKVSWAFAEPAEPRAEIAKALTQLYTLTEEWLELVLATGVEQRPGHIGA
jgi:Lon protease-like protein